MKKIIYTLLATFILLTWMSCNPSLSDSEIHETIYVRHKGADMPAYVHGNAAKRTFLIVVHGAGSFGLSFRKGAFTDLLEEEYTVVYFDQRGQSMAQGYYENPDDLISLMSEDIDALIRVLKHQYGNEIKLFLLGHSLGGLLTANTLNLNGVQSNLKGWINVDGLLDIPSVSYYRKELILQICEDQITNSSKTIDWTSLKNETEILSPENNQDYDEILKKAAQTVKLLQAEGIVQQSPDNETTYRALVDNNPIHWLVSNYFNQPVQNAISQNISLLGQMPNIMIPSLFIYGKYDVSVPPKSGAQAFELLGTQEKSYHVFEKSIHHPMDSEPNAFGALIFEFIEQFR